MTIESEGLDVPTMGVIVFEVMLNQKENLSTGSESKSVRRPQFRSSRGLVFLIVVVAGFFRFFDLGLKPPHFDEGINGHFVTTIWRDGFYTYDPTNFHGPLYFYLCHLAEIILGRSIDSFRAMNGVLAMFVVVLVYRFRQFTGAAATIAAWMMAVSPAFTFYGRYAIHETLFVLGQLMFVFGRFSWMSRPTRSALAWMAVGATILISTKETFFIFFGIWFIAEFCVWRFELLEKAHRNWSTFSALSEAEKRDLILRAALYAGLALFALAALYTGFFEWPQGINDFARAFKFWSKTGVGAASGHEKPFTYWLELLSRYEWALAVGLVFSLYGMLCLRTEDRKQRILLFTGFGTWLAYSLIPYKTPWLILNFWPLAFFTFPVANQNRRTRLFYPCLVFLLLSVSIYKSWQLNFVHPTDASEPYVYVQTTEDYSTVMNVLKKKVERNPEVRNTPIIIMIQDPWPLPFDLSLYPKMRYAKVEDLVKDPDIIANAGLMLVDGSLLKGLRNVFPKRFARMKFQLRDSYGSGWALFDAELFNGVLPAGVEFEEPAEVGSGE